MDEKPDRGADETRTGMSRPRGWRLNQAGFGVASCTAFRVVLICLAAGGILLAVAPAVDPEGTSLYDYLNIVHMIIPYVIHAGMLAAVGYVASGIGFLLGLVGLRLTGRRRALAMAGVVLNGLVFLPYSLLLAWGFLVGDADTLTP